VARCLVTLIAQDCGLVGVTVTYVRVDRRPFRMTFLLAVAAILAAALVVGYVAVAIVLDVPSVGRSWPGQGFVVVAAVAVIGFASLIDALRSGRARRSTRRRPDADQGVPHGSDEQHS
jgi:TRAP-type C4-dicarboxylate transport system permease small subunit